MHVRRRFAVVGSPIAHSLSPLLHRTAYAALGVQDASYERFEVAEGELGAFLASGPGRELDGLSVTMPGKPEAFALAQEADATATRLQIANTLIRRPDGTWRAENHDVHGIVRSLQDHGIKAPRIEDPALAGRIAAEHAAARRRIGAVLGSGATALSAVTALLELGCTRILLTARSPHKLAPLQELAHSAGAATHTLPWADSHRVLEAEMVVSALSLEGARTVATTWSAHSELARPAVLLDALYAPWPAPIAEVVQRHGTEVASGLEMLVHQADMQIRSMLGVPVAPTRQMLQAALEHLGSAPSAS